MKLGAHKNYLLAVILSLLLIPLMVNIAHGDGSFQFSDKLTAGTSMEFGRSVAVSGDTVVVGDPVEGAAYVFVKGSQVARLTGSDISGFFGYSVAISGDTVAVGAPVEMGFLGSVYVFKREGGTWPKEWETKLNASKLSFGFGWSLAFDGSTLAVGSAMSTSVYVFSPDGGNWPLEAELNASDAVQTDRFGWSVAVSGDRIIVGAPWDNLVVQDPDDPDGTITLPAAGSVYVFQFDLEGNTWVETKPKLTAEDAAEYDLFGSSVAIHDNTVVVGAPKDASNLTPPAAINGAAYVFKFDGESWPEQAKLTAGADSADYDQFGYSVAIKDSILLVGAPVYYDPNDMNQDSKPGAAYLFERDGNAWPEKDTLTASDAGDPPKTDQFGFAVAFNQVNLVVGAILADAGTEMPDAGAVYVYETNEPPTAEAQAKPEKAKEGDTVFLEGSGDDPDGDPLKLKYQWKQMGTDDAPLVDLVDADKQVASFVAPELSEGCAELSFQLIVVDEKGLASEPAEVKIKVSPNNEIHAKLGGKHRHWLYWHKYSFYGHDTDNVTIRLEADQDGWHRGSKATLILKDNIKHTRLLQTKRGSLPLEISTPLPADGKYTVYVLKQPWFWSWWRHTRFEGDYILSLEGICGKLVNGSKCNKR